MSDNNDATLRGIIISQYLAALEMLRKVIEKCPDDLWLSRAMRNQMWRVAYHTLFYAHFYLQPTSENFERWSKHRDEVESDPEHERADAAPYSRQELLEYLDLCVEQVKLKVPGMDFTTESGFAWYRCSKLELQFISIRHIQQHVGELGEQLSDKAGIESPWMGIGRR